MQANNDIERFKSLQLTTTTQNTKYSSKNNLN